MTHSSTSSPTPTRATDVCASLNHDCKHLETLWWEPWRTFARSILEEQDLMCSGFSAGVRAIFEYATAGSMGRADNPQVYSGRLDQPHIFISELHLLLSPESSPSDPSANTPSSYPTLSEVFGRKRKKRTSIETNIRLTLEKRFQDVSSLLGWEGWASLCRWVSGSHMWRKLVSVPSSSS